MDRNTFYAVAVGKNPGIYTNWQDCQKQVVGYPGAKYKKFTSKEKGIEYIKNNDLPKLSSENDQHLYLVERLDKRGYDSYSSFVACCETEQQAREIHPGGKLYNKENQSWDFSSDWIDGKHLHDYLRVTFLGPLINKNFDIKESRGVILASYHSG
jgi:hypothetical protein